MAKLSSCPIVVHCTLVKHMLKCFIGIKHLANCYEGYGMCNIFSICCDLDFVVNIEVCSLVFHSQQYIIAWETNKQRGFSSSNIKSKYIAVILTTKRLYGCNVFFFH
jgi:hypothetical protein